MTTDLTDPTVTGSETMLEIQSLQTAKEQSEIRRGFEVIQEYVTNSTDPEEIAEILEDIYYAEEKNSAVSSAFQIELGIQGMTVENGFLVKDGKLKGNVKDILLAIEKRGFAPNILDATYEEWKNTWEYTQTEVKGGTKVLQMVLEEDFFNDPSIVDKLRRDIVNEGGNLLSRIPVDKGKIIKGFNTEKVMVAMFNGLDGSLIDKWSDVEILKMIQLYKICKENKIIGKLERVEKILNI